MPFYPTENFLNNFSESVLKVLAMIMENDYSEKTKRAITSDIRIFLEWYEKRNNEGFIFSRITTREVLAFRDEHRKLGHSVATVNRRLVMVRLFCEQAMTIGLLSENPSKKVKQLSQQSLAPQGLTPKEVRRFIKEVDIRGSKRDKLIIELMIGAGLRVSDITNIHLSDVHISSRMGFIIIRKGKGYKTRKVPLHKNIRHCFSEYLNTLKEEKEDEKIFVGQRGILTNLAINKIVEKYSKYSGIKLSPHTLRHTFAYAYLKKNPADIVGLSQILGHTNINTTARYTQNRLEDLQEKIENLCF